MPEQYANNAKTTLNGAINNSTTSITVTDGSVFPSSGDYRLKVDSELMLCTARSGNTLTVTRGIESTTAASHSDLAQISLVLTKQSFINLLTEGSQKGARSSRPVSAQTGTWYYPTDYGLPSRYNGSSWDVFHPLVGRFVNTPVISDFTWDSQGNALAYDRDGIYLTQTFTGATNNHSMLYKTPGTTYTMTCGFSLGGSNSQFLGVGLFAKENSTGKIITWSYRQEPRIQADYWTTATSYSSTLGQVGANGVNITGCPIWSRLQRTGSNRIFSWSINGYDWSQAFSPTAHNDHITGNEDRVGVSIWVYAPPSNSNVVCQAHIFDFSLT